MDTGESNDPRDPIGYEDFDVRRDHRYGKSRYLEDFKVGETFYIPSRTMTEALFAAFSARLGRQRPDPL